MDIREITPIETIIERDLKRKNVCAYARVSTLKEVAHMSFDTQVQTYTKMILDRPDWNFIGVYADEGKSGTNTHKRTQFSMMLDMAKSGLIDLIITKSISRFSRSVVDTVSILQDLRNHRVEVWFENENISSFDSKIEFVISVLSGVAEEEARNVSENVKWNVRKRFSEGKFFLVTKGFLGYTRNDNGELIVDDHEASVVRKIYELYTTGTGVSKIIEYLNENNIKTTYNKGKWYGNAVYNILKNEKYTGNALLQKTNRPSFKAKLKVKNETLPMYYVENSHPPIISQELFDLAQQIRRSQIDKFHHTTSSVVEKDKYNKHTIYKGLLKCPHCGKSYIHRSGTGKSEYSKAIMMCPSNKMKKTCPGETISVSILEQAIHNQLMHIVKNKVAISMKIEQSVLGNPRRELLIRQINELEHSINNLVLSVENMQSKVDDFHSQVQEQINSDIMRHRFDLANLKNILSTKFNLNLIKQNFNKAISTYLKNSDLEQLLFNITDSIVVHNKNKLTFYLVYKDSLNEVCTDNLLIRYMIRKTENRLEHSVML